MITDKVRYKQLLPFFSIYIVMVLSMCQFSEYRVLDLKAFSVTILKKWKYDKQKGIDSFIGRISTGKNTLHFDLSFQGYANFGIDTEKEYLESKTWLSECLFCDDNVTYTSASDLKAVREDVMKESGITDTTLVKVQANIKPEIKIIRPDPKNNKKYPFADYLAELKHKDSIIIVPIFIPEEIKAHNFLMDTTAAYITKTVWPKQIGKGTTGVFIKARKNRLTFNLVGQNLNKFDQEEALKAFKSLKMRNEE